MFPPRPGKIVVPYLLVSIVAVEKFAICPGFIACGTHVFFLVSFKISPHPPVFEFFSFFLMYLGEALVYLETYFLRLRENSCPKSVLDDDQS